MFQARTWDWKRVAARLLLVPVLTGGTAAAASAQQFGQPGASRAVPPPPPGALGMPAGGPSSAAGLPTGPSAAGPTAEIKALLKEGRRALAAGNLDAAQDTARRVKASDPGVKWGVFDDTPAALERDVAAARTKADKAEAARLVVIGRGKLDQKAGTDAERTYNLDQALQAARRAEQLHGPYTVWDRGDRADKLVKDVEAALMVARARVPVPPTTQAGRPGVAAVGTPAAATPPAVRQASASVAAGATPATPGTTPVAARPTTVVPAAGVARTDTRSGTARVGAGAPPATAPAPVVPTVAATPRPAPAVDPRKVSALKLMAEGRQLADKGAFGAAMAKYDEAGRQNAAFAPGEPYPGILIQELKARGAEEMDRLVREGQALTAQKDFARADAALAAAADIAQGVGLYGRPVVEAQMALKQAAAPAPMNPVVAAGVPPVATTPAASPVTTPPVPTPEVLPPVTPTTPLAVTPPAVETPAAPMAMVPPMPTTVAGRPDVTGMPGMVAAPASLPPSTSAKTSLGGGAVTGRQMLDAAALEFRKGDFANARQIALRAYNAGGVQDEAKGLLNQIDAEKYLADKASALKAFDAAAASYAARDYRHAGGVLALTDPTLLPADKRAKRDELMAACQAQLDKKGGESAVRPAGSQAAADGLPPVPAAEALAPKAGGSDAPLRQADAMRRVKVDKLRSEGLKVMQDAQSAMGRLEADVAMGLLADYANRVRAAGVEPADVKRLLEPIETRAEQFRTMKGQADYLAGERRDKKAARELVYEKGAAEEQRKAEIGKLVRRFNHLVKVEKNYAEAEKVALQAKQLDPDDATVAALAEMAKVQRRVKEAQAIKDDKEKLVLGGLNDADRVGPVVTTAHPLEIQLDAFARSGKRGPGEAYVKARTPAEFEIEMKLERPISVPFTQTPLRQAIEEIGAKADVPVYIDEASIAAEGSDVLVKPFTANFTGKGGLSAKNALALALESGGLSFVIENDVVKVTTLRKSKGRLVTKVFSVADLVTPIPNFAIPDYANLSKILSKSAIDSPQAMINGQTTRGAMGLGGGQQLNSAMAGTTGGVPGSAMGGGTLQNSQVPQGTTTGGMGTQYTQQMTKHEQLIKLVTGMVRPFSWDTQGGPGKVEFFDIGSALVVNQTGDVISEVQALLDSLRRLQDLAVAVEIRIVSLSETFFERMGVDFSVNVKTSTTKFEPNLTTQVFRPEPFINDINQKGVTTGLTPAGTFTPDLDVPIRANSFQYAVPGFGGYPNNPGNNGGVSLGLAFLNDIQVFMFMEAAQGDRRQNIMQAPKLTLFNGQTATISVSDFAYFVSNVQVFSVNGQVVFVPQNTPLPIGTQGGLGGQIGVQAVVSADRRFVRITPTVALSTITGSTVPLFPVTTFITPVFEGGSQGQPIPFTQFLQQPAISTIDVQTTVVCPDGGTVLLGGFKYLAEGRNEFGPPFLSKVPYLNRLFKNVGIGRETRHLMLMITPRIIITAEEEIIQTEGGRPPASQ